MNKTPIVSVIIPTHNRPIFLDEALSSVANQSITDWEIIIVDDNSCPPVNQLEIQNKFGANIVVRYHNISLGGAAAKNTGIDAATGKYITFLDDDDKYDNKYLENAITTLEQNNSIKTLFMGVKWFGPNAEWSQTDYDNAMNKMLQNANGLPINKSLTCFEEKKLFSALLQSIPMGFQRVVSLKKDFLVTGYYKPDCLLWDCDWAIRASLKGRCGLLNEGLYLQRNAGQGYSSTPKRRLEHQLSNLEIKKKLLDELSISDLKDLINSAIIEASQALSWGYMHQKQNYEAFKTMLQSFRYGLTPLQIKFLLHILYNSILNKT